jgi:NADH-quinone oxidoreductase subunit J
MNLAPLGYAFFYGCALLALLGAIGTIAAKNPIRGAMGLLVMIVSIAGLFLALHAEFLAAIQLIVYAGAIVVLFLFVIMLLGPSAATPSDHRGRIPRVFAASLFGVAGLGAAAAIAVAVSQSTKSLMGPTGYPSPAANFGGVESFGRIIFTQGLVPFELSSALLMVAIVGAVAVARGRHKSDQPAPSSVASTLAAANLPHAGQAPRTAGGITREAP